MNLTDDEWREILREMAANHARVRAWEPALPDPAATRCEESRHRTLAHLRACQETWLEACRAFAREEGARVKLLHPWRRFAQGAYEAVPWEDHLAAFLVDRAEWNELLESADRGRAGTVNGQAHSLASLTRRLVLHERHHLTTLR